MQEAAASSLNENINQFPSFTHESYNHSHQIPPCRLSIEDLKSLYASLKEKAKEAIEYELRQFLETPNQFKPELKQHLLDNCLWIEVNGIGEYKCGHDKNILDKLPKKIISIEFRVDLTYQNLTQQQLSNFFKIVFCFTSSKLADFSYVRNIEAASNNHFFIAGKSKTWIDGTYKYITDFFTEKRTRRNWLYTSWIYDFLLITFFWPSLITTIYKLDSIFIKKFTLYQESFVRVAVCLYLSLIILYGFRLLFNLKKYLFPYIEIQEHIPKTRSILNFILNSTVFAPLGSEIFSIAKGLIS